MRILRGALSVIAILAILMGLLWVGQGLGIIMWPSDSFMLADRKWAVNGSILAAVGLLVIVLTRRSGR
jgi:nitrate reductase gamma subunit